MLNSDPEQFLLPLSAQTSLVTFRQMVRDSWVGTDDNRPHYFLMTVFGMGNSRRGFFHIDSFAAPRFVMSTMSFTR